MFLFHKKKRKKEKKEKKEKKRKKKKKEKRLSTTFPIPVLLFEIHGSRNELLSQ